MQTEVAWRGSCARKRGRELYHKCAAVFITWPSFRCGHFYDVMTFSLCRFLSSSLRCHFLIGTPPRSRRHQNCILSFLSPPRFWGYKCQNHNMITRLFIAPFLQTKGSGSLISNSTSCKQTIFLVTPPPPQKKTWHSASLTEVHI